MSASNEWTEWHLTPRGWERGTEKEDFRRTERPPPADRVQTIVYKEFMSSTFSKVDKTQTTEWESDDKAAIQKLRREFGGPPQSL